MSRWGMAVPRTAFTRSVRTRTTGCTGVFCWSRKSTRGPRRSEVTPLPPGPPRSAPGPPPPRSAPGPLCARPALRPARPRPAPGPPAATAASRPTKRSTAVGSHLGVHPPLEAHPGLGVQAQPLSRPGDGHRGEPRRFQQDPLGVRAYLGTGPAHDPADPDGHAGGVADDAVIAFEPASHTVEGLDRLARSSPPDQDPPAAEEGEVVGMVGLADVEHDVVGDVDDGVDGPHARQGQPPGHPGRRRAPGYALEDGGGEPGAQVAALDHQAGDAEGRVYGDGRARGWPR